MNKAPSTLRKGQGAPNESVASYGGYNNNFGNQQLTGVYGSMAPAVAREVAQIQGQIMMAKAYPRNMDVVIAKVESACSRKTLAEHALYTYARGGTDISGPTIRLMEAVASAYGNIKAGYEVVESDPEKSRIRAYAYDMETNTVIERNFDVEHIRYTKAEGRKRLTDPRDIYEKIANDSARRVRACLQQIIPGDIVDYAVTLSRQTLVANVDTSPAARASLVTAFLKYGVTKVMIEAYIQRKMDAITADQIVKLRGVYASLRDGMATVTDFFDPDAKPIGEKEPQTETPAPARKPAAKTQQKQRTAREEKPQPVTQTQPESDDEEEAETEEDPYEGKGPESFEDDEWPDEAEEAFDDDPELY